MNTTEVVRGPGRLHTAISMLALAMLLLGGCGGDQSGAAEVINGGEDQSSQAPAGPVDTASTDPGGGASDTGASATVDLPRSVTYADWEWTVEDATVADGQATLDITVANTLQVRNEFDEVRLENLSLLDGNGTAMTPVDPLATGTEPLDLNVTAGGRSQGTLAFEVDDAFSLNTASFQIAQPGAEPAILPFSVAQPENPYPIEADISAKAKKGSAFPSSTVFKFKPLSATAHLDAGGVRVPEGSRWLTVTLRVTGEDGNGIDGHIGAQNVRLVVDGNALEAGLAPNTTVGPGESIELDYIFEIPLDASDVKLKVGEASDTTDFIQSTIPLDLPDLPELQP